VAQRHELVLGQVVVVRERLQLLLLDEAALGGLLDKALGRREVVQMNRVAQWNPFRSWCGARGVGLLCRPVRGFPATPVSLCDL